VEGCLDVAPGGEREGKRNAKHGQNQTPAYKRTTTRSEATLIHDAVSAHPGIAPISADRGPRNPPKVGGPAHRAPARSDRGPMVAGARSC